MILLSASMSAQPVDRARYIDELVAAERAFRADVARLGVRDGFLAHLADDAVLFRPTAVNGPAYLRTQDSAPGLLEWEPEYADVSTSGDLGFTTGPWTMRQSERDTVAAAAAGMYVSVWRRDGSGRFKVAIDHGVGLGRTLPVPEPREVYASKNPPVPAEGVAMEVDAGGRVIDREAARTLLQSESDLAARMATADGYRLVLQSARYDAWFLRRGEDPLKGTGAIYSYFQRNPGRLRLSPSSAYVARSGDLGYAYGTYDFSRSDGSSAESGNYLRIWRRGADGWKIQLELLSPTPPRPAATPSE